MAERSWLRTWVNRGAHRRGRRANHNHLPLRLESLEFRELPSSGALLFDFGTATSPVAKEYDQVTPATAYQPSRGYGWLTGQVTGTNRGSGSTPPPRMTRDFNSTADGAFAVDLPSGVYQVTLTFGDAAAAHDQMGVFLEGAQVDTVSVQANQFVNKTYQATVTDGQLTLGLRDLGGTDPSAIINGLRVAYTGPSGLVAAYGFNEGSGTVLSDSSGGGLNGTVSGATWSAAGRYGGALSFNGTNSTVTVPDAAALDLTTGMTLEAWVNPTAINGWETVLLKEDGSEAAYSLYADNNGNDTGGPRRPAAYARQGTAYAAVVGTAQLPLNAWTHLAATFDGATLRLYVNGAPAGSQAAAGAINVSAGALRIGGNSIWGEYFNGLIDEVRVYNRALSQTEIQADMNAAVTSGPPGPLQATFAGGAANEGSAGQVGFSNVTGGSGGYSYSYDFNNDGTFEVSNSASPTAAVPASYLADGPVSRTVRGRVRDSSGATADYTTAVSITNVSPTAQLGGPYAAAPGAAINFSATVTDPSPSDVAAGFTYLWNFGDGTTSTQPSPSKAYAAAGNYTVTLTVTDKDGGASSATATAAVAAAPVGFPNNTNPPPLPAPAGPVIRISTVGQLQSAVANLRAGETILIDPGTYTLTGPLYLPQGISNVAVRGATGRSGDVVIRGAGMSGSVTFGFWVGNAQGVIFGDLTVRDFSQHGIILNAGAESPLIHNVRMADIGDQMIKANPDGAGGGVDNGVVEYSVFEYTSGWAPDYYVAGLDVHTGRNWLVRFNTFKNMRLPAGAGQPTTHPAVLMWNGSQGSSVQWNTFINNDRDIALGLYQAAQDNAAVPDHSGGRIDGNMIYRDASTRGDVAIGLTGPNTKVYHNTYYDASGAYPNAVEYRWANTTNTDIKNNLTNRAIAARDGATGSLGGNVTTAQSSWFVNSASGDLHLTASATPAMNSGAVLASPLADYDGNSRPAGSAPDVGADEFVAVTDTTPPTASVTGPAGGATVSGTVTVSANASDNVGVVGVQFFLDGSPLGAEDTTAPYSVSWNTAAAANGAHTLASRARDAAGNQTTSSPVTVTVSNANPDTTPPTVSAVSPAAGAAGVATATNVTVTFSEAVGAATVTGSTVQLRDTANNLVAATVTYNATTRTATLDPTPTLANSTTYTVRVLGGALGVKDLAGNTLAADYSASFTTAATGPTQPSLLHQSDLQYVGAFRLPSGTLGASSFSYGGTALAFNPANNSLFLVGHDYDQAIAEVRIPTSIVNSSNVNNLATATVLQPFVSVLSRVPNFTLTGNVKIGGLQIVNGQLVGTAYEYYDADVNAVQSHFVLNSLNLSTANVGGLYTVGTLGGGYVGGYMAPVPAEWQAALGAPYVTGQAALSIIGRTSSGPALFGFDPARLGASPAPATPYVNYPLSHPLGVIDQANQYFNGNTEIRGVVFAPGTSSVLFFGSHGIGAVGYGEAAEFNDPYRGGKGWHSVNGQYAYQVWAYDVNDLIAVKNGLKQPWEIRPYEVWNFNLPLPDGARHIGGVAFDPATGRLYVSQQNTGPDATPVIHVYQL